MHQPLISIAIPAFKASFLSNAIQSVLEQTYTNIELIIVNDNSPEPIDEVVNKFMDKRIRYYKNARNIGHKDPSLNWNRCLDYAIGDFFSLLCDDDMLEKTFVEEMLTLHDHAPNVNVFRSRVKTINEKNEIIGLYPSSPYFETCTDYMWQKMSGFRKQTISEFFFDTQYIKKLGGYTNTPRAWTADALSIYKFAWENGIISTTKPLVYFRESKNNISCNFKDALEKREALFIYKNEINGLINKIQKVEERKILQESLRISFFQEIISLCSNASFLDIIRIMKKRGFPLKWLLFIIPQKLSNIQKKYSA